ncbi:MAG: chromate transporter, partial [Erysipelothrix sp.]|nr:chromate transporter [Erysipelothrix sp.]
TLRSIGEFLNFCIALPMSIIKITPGMIRASEAMIPPANDPTVNPAYVAMLIPMGPGVDSDIAIISTSIAAVNQFVLTVRSFAGGIIASLALIIPGVILMMLIGNAMQKFKNSPILLKVFYGIRPAVAALIAYAAWEIIKVTMLSNAADLWQAQLKYPAIGFFLFLLFLLKRFKIHPIAIIAMAAVAGTIVSF